MTDNIGSQRVLYKCGFEDRCDSVMEKDGEALPAKTFVRRGGHSPSV